jgi:hypothetical protein
MVTETLQQAMPAILFGGFQRRSRAVLIIAIRVERSSWRQNAAEERGAEQQLLMGPGRMRLIRDFELRRRAAKPVATRSLDVWYGRRQAQCLPKEYNL